MKDETPQRETQPAFMGEDYFSADSPWGTLRPHSWSGFWLRLSRGSGFTLKVLGSWLPSRFALLSRRLARARLDGPVDTVVWGQKLRLFPNRSVSEARILFLPWHWDYVERARLRPWVKPGFTFVDVGANVGGYTFWISSLTGSQARIVAVEPDPALVRQLRYNVGVNGAETSIRIVEAAVGAAPGKGQLIRNPVNSGENRLAREEAGGDANRDSDRVVPVRVRMLRAIVEEAELERIDLLKVDVEGHERDVLEPFFAEAPASLRPRLLLVEMKPGAESRAMESWIAEQGYRLECRTLLNGLFRRADVVGRAAPARRRPVAVRRAAPARPPAPRARPPVRPAPARSAGTAPS